MNISWYNSSIVGRRQNNEDRYYVPVGKHKKSDKLIFGVFDGHSSNIGDGDSVSIFLKKNLIKRLYKNIENLGSRKYIRLCHDDVNTQLKKSRVNKFTTGSTSIILIIDKIKKYCLVANVGDCRAIMCREKSCQVLTTDHKAGAKGEIQRIRSLGGSVTRYKDDVARVNGLAVSRSFGDHDSLPYITYKPDVFKYKLTKSDKFIVIASDGLWDVLTNHYVVSYVLKNIKNPLVAENLAQEAYKAGSYDNITLIIVML